MTDKTLQIAYKILKALESGRRGEYAGALIGPYALQVDEQKWADVMQTLQEDGYIAGMEIRRNVLGETEYDIEKVRITMKGAEYLNENGFMKKIGRVATNVITILK